MEKMMTTRGGKKEDKEEENCKLENKMKGKRKWYQEKLKNIIVSEQKQKKM